MDPKMSYRLLGLEPGSTQKQIRQAYLSLAKQCHPDKLQTTNKGSTKENPDFIGINHAYHEALGDARKRREVEQCIHKLIASSSQQSDGSQFGQVYFEQQRKRMSEIYESWRRDFNNGSDRRQKQQKNQPQKPNLDEPKSKKKLKKPQNEQLPTQSFIKSLIKQRKPIFHIIK